MFEDFRSATYSHRAWLLALFVACAMLLGGGGTPNPVTEVILQLLFVAAALAWIYVPSKRRELRVDRRVIAIIAIVLALPLAQLVPLPPFVWHELPGRENARKALELVNAADRWMPLSLSPSRTLASFLAMVPAALCVYAAATLSFAERRLILLTIVAIGTCSALLGMMQLLSGSGSLNLYSVFSRGWVTGFQANRNAAADILLIALLALAACVFGPATRAHLPRRSHLNPNVLVAGMLGAFLLVATALTGSRAGMALSLPVLAIIGMIALSNPGDNQSRSVSMLLAVAALPLLLLAGIWAVAAAGSVPLSRALARFGDFDNQRLGVWKDTAFAMSENWPLGVGMGGFEPAIFAVERLEIVNRTFPNRAHNEYLEIGLEAGILGYILIAAAGAVLAVMAAQAWRDRPQMRHHILFASGVFVVIALHSVVDYPLRSMAIATLAGIAAGMMARPTETDRSAERPEDNT